MSVYLDADAVVLWEKREFDLPGWLRARFDEPAGIPSTVWQQLQFGVFGWEKPRADKRTRSLQVLRGVPVISFARAHAERAAQLQADLKREGIGLLTSRSPPQPWRTERIC